MVPGGERGAALGAAALQVHGARHAAVAERVPAARHVRLRDQLEAHRAQQLAVLPNTTGLYAPGFTVWEPVSKYRSHG